MDLTKLNVDLDLSKVQISSPNSQCQSETSTQNLINDGISISEYEIRKDDVSLPSDQNKFKCNNCDFKFRNKQTLDIHQRTSLKCSSNSDASSVSSDSVKYCEYCEKYFASKQMRLYHESKCIKKIISEMNKKHDSEIQILKNQIIELQKCM